MTHAMLDLRRRGVGFLLAAVVVASAAALMAASASAGVIHLDNLTDEVPPIDNGVCTLREAITEANTDLQTASDDCHFSGALGDDTITLPAGTLTITGPDDSATGEANNMSGDFDAKIGNGDSLTIQGAGQNATTIDAAGKDRAFDLFKFSTSVLGARRFTLQDVTVRNGLTQSVGGAIRGQSISSDDGHVVLDHTTLTDNRASTGGGAVYAADATVDLLDSTVAGNKVVTSSVAVAGGGIWVGGTNGGPAGLNSVRSTISNNSVEAATGATGSPFGGGVYLKGATPASQQVKGNFVDTTISNNTVKGQFLASTQGAGMNTIDVPVTMKGSTVSGNKNIPFAGALNTVSAGFTFRDTSPQQSPGQAANDHLNIDNSTFAENDSGPSQSAGNYANVAGLSIQNGIARLSNLTFFDNESGGPGKDLNYSGSNGSSGRIRSSILGDAGACGGTFSGLASDGNNLEVGGDSCNFAGGTGTTPGINGDRENLLASQVNLGELGPNGGPTQTVPLGAGSVAIDAVPAAQCLDSTGVTQTKDQRGVDRPDGAACDTGAYELAFCQGQPVTLIGTPGNDLLDGTAGNDVVAAGAGNDTINTFGGADRVCAGDGDDVVNPGPDHDNDTIQGEGGTDTLIYADATTAVDVDLLAGTATGQGSDSVTGFENLTGSDNDDILSGTADANIIRAGDGIDTVSAREGADQVFVRDGLGDSVDCGAGVDSVQADVQGTDALSDCETTDFMPTPTPPKIDQPIPIPPGGGETKPVKKPAKCKRKKGKKGKKKASAAKKKKKQKKGCKKK